MLKVLLSKELATQMMSSPHPGSLAMTTYQVQTLRSLMPSVQLCLLTGPAYFLTGHSQALLNRWMLGSLSGQPRFREDRLCTQIRQGERGWAPGSTFSHSPVLALCASYLVTSTSCSLFFPHVLNKGNRLH